MNRQEMINLLAIQWVYVRGFEDEKIKHITDYITKNYEIRKLEYVFANINNVDYLTVIENCERYPLLIDCFILIIKLNKYAKKCNLSFLRSNTCETGNSGIPYKDYYDAYYSLFSDDIPKPLINILKCAEHKIDIMIKIADWNIDYLMAYINYYANDNVNICEYILYKPLLKYINCKISGIESLFTIKELIEKIQYLKLQNLELNTVTLLLSNIQLNTLLNYNTFPDITKQVNSYIDPNMENTTAMLAQYRYYLITGNPDVLNIPFNPHQQNIFKIHSNFVSSDTLPNNCAKTQYLRLLNNSHYCLYKSLINKSNSTQIRPKDVLMLQLARLLPEELFRFLLNLKPNISKLEIPSRILHYSKPSNEKSLDFIGFSIGGFSTLICELLYQYKLGGNIVITVQKLKYILDLNSNSLEILKKILESTQTLKLPYLTLDNLYLDNDILLFMKMKMIDNFII